MPNCAGRCGDLGARRPRSNRCPGRTPGCARGAKASWNRIQTLEAQLARLRATGAVLSKALFGRKSEKQETPRSWRPRGQQRGAPGHGRTQRPGLEERTEELKPPEEARVCSCCGKAYVANGAEESTLVEIEVKAHKRVIRRPRWRRACGCASSPIEVSAPPVPRLFRNTPYGISVWTCVLFERYACYRPLKRVAAWLSDRGLPISPGSLADIMLRFVPLFEPVAGAILAHQDKAALRHADETSWRVQELRGEDRSSRAWLWTSVSSDAVYFHIDPSRSAEAAEKLFAAALLHTVIVCDRYRSYEASRETGATVPFLETSSGDRKCPQGTTPPRQPVRSISRCTLRSRSAGRAGWLASRARRASGSACTRSRRRTSKVSAT